MLVVSDLEDVFLPKPSDLLVNVVEARPAIESMLKRLSDMFKDTYVTGSALGAGLQAAFKLVVSLRRVSFDFCSSELTSRPRFSRFLSVEHRRKDHRSHRYSSFDRSRRTEE